MKSQRTGGLARPLHPVLAAGALAAVVAQGADAHAVPCADLNLPNPIYGSGGSAITATLAAVATRLAGAAEPVTILFQDPGACIGYDSFIANKLTGTIKYWNAAGTQLTCDLPTLGREADFAHMGNTATFCPGRTQPAGVGDFTGPIQTINIITDKDSSQSSISSEALYYILGRGASTSNITPWTNDAHVTLRTSTSFVHLFLAAAIGVPPDRFRSGVAAVSSNQASITAVATAGNTNAESPIAYCSGSAADRASDSVKTLALQHYGQSCGYLPDSSPTRLDKVNVRDGQYALWTPGHFFARVDGEGRIINPRVADLIGWFQGTVAPPEGVNVTEIVIQSGDIPECAMRVKREGVVGAISSFAPASPCGCYFERVALGATECTACVDDTACSSGGKCRYGYCEAY